MEKDINYWAYHFRNNRLAIFFVRPFWRLKRKIQERKRNKLFRSNALNLLKQLKTTLDDNGVFFWLEFGTLLGAYREHDFIKHDFDLDIGVFFKDTQQIRPILESGGFKLIHQFIAGDGELGFEQTFVYQGVTVDVFYFHKEETSMYCNSFSHFTDDFDHANQYQVKKITLPYSGFKTMGFKGLEFNVPVDIEKHLRANYGENFMTPNPHFDYRKEATNVHFYPKEERVGVFEKEC